MRLPRVPSTVDNAVLCHRRTYLLYDFEEVEVSL